MGICTACSNLTKGRRKLCGWCQRKEDGEVGERGVKEEPIPANPGPILNLGIPNRDEEPAWAKLVRENLPPSRGVGPPPNAIPEDMEERLNLETPFVELTLCEHGRYTGPTRGRVLRETGAGFVFLTVAGLYFVTWSNLAYWVFLSEV